MPDENQKEKPRLKQLKFREKIHVAKDEKWPEGRPTDIIIPVMGQTGVGKSTFINCLMQRKVVHVGHNLDSCTVQLQPIIVHPEEPQLVIVNTPGFNATYEDDSEILRHIATCYGKGMTLGGVLYLHNITQNRIITSRQTLEVFRKLCGDNALPSVVLIMTKWNEVPAATGERREQQLREKHWKEMFSRGSQIMRFEGTSKSAWVIVNPLKEKKLQSLQIQREVVELKKAIPDTDAGKELRRTLEEFLSIAKDSGSDDLEQLKALIDRIWQEIQRLGQGIIGPLTMAKALDETWEGGWPTDIVIPIVGPTGVGKSTFVNHFVGREAARIGHDLESCTEKLQPIVVGRKDGRQLVIVDTSSFDESCPDGSIILKRIKVWLRKTYGGGMTLGGIVYLYNIAQTPPKLGTPLQNVDTFQKLCGEDALRLVTLVTTHWGEVAEDVEQERKKHLHKNYWKWMADQGSAITRFGNSTDESSQEIVESLVATYLQLQHPQPMVLLLRQTGSGKSTFINTAAGGQPLVGVSDEDDLYGENSTTDISYFSLQSPSMPGQSVVLIDTPGFDNYDTNVQDSQILDKIIKRLNEYKKAADVYGIIYLLDLKHETAKGGPYFSPSALSNAKSPNLARNVSLTSTHWNPGLEYKEMDLGKTYREFLQGNSKLSRFKKMGDLAWNVIDGVMKMDLMTLKTLVAELKKIRDALK